MSCSISFLNALLYCTSLTSGCLKTTTSYWLKPAINCWNFGQFSRDRQRFIPWMGRLYPCSIKIYQLGYNQLTEFFMLLPAAIATSDQCVLLTRMAPPCRVTGKFSPSTQSVNQAVFFPVVAGKILTFPGNFLPICWQLEYYLMRLWRDFLEMPG